MHEKRTIKRFALQVEAKCCFDNLQSKAAETEKCFTKNISSKGAFLLTHQSLPVGAKVGIHFFIPLPPTSETANPTTVIKTIGKVVRTTNEGMAVCFNSRCRIVGVSP